MKGSVFNYTKRYVCTIAHSRTYTSPPFLSNRKRYYIFLIKFELTKFLLKSSNFYLCPLCIPYSLFTYNSLAWSSLPPDDQMNWHQFLLA